MREKLFLFSSIAFLIGGAQDALFIAPSIAESPSTASGELTFTASLKSTGDHAVAPIRRVLVEMQKEKEQKETPPVFRTHYKQRATIQPFNHSTIQPSNYSPIHPAIDKPDINIQHRLIANEVLQTMPITCRNHLKNFYVRYNSNEGRGLGGKSTIILNGNVSDDEFRALFIHEFGHLVDLGCLQGSSFAQSTEYRDGSEVMRADDPSVRFYQISWLSSNVQNVGTTDADFVSGYASWDMFEDFAESFTYYMLHKSEFAKRAEQNPALAAKYAWFQEEMPSLPSLVASSNSKWNGAVPWDVTKLKYAWVGN